MAAAQLPAFLFVLFSVLPGSGESAEELHAAAGKDVLLNCSCRQPANITALNWLRLHMSDYVLFYRDNHPYNDYQHPQYRGRVRLVDPQVANRNLSIVLSNVSTQDAGTYWCRVGLAGGEEASTFIDLKVAPPLSDDPNSSDHTEEANTDGRSRLTLILPFAVFLVIIPGIFICAIMRRSSR